MPHVVVKLASGRSAEQRQQLADKIAQDVAAILKCKEELISVALEEITPADWMDSVYKPEIQGKWTRF